MTKRFKKTHRRTAWLRTSAAALCAALLSSACGGPDEGELADDETESAIVGGTTDNDNRYPAVVRIEMNFREGTRNCSATAITDSILLTAAHCVYNPPLGGNANYVTVIKATGGNASSDGATSTQLVVHNVFRRDYSGDNYSGLLIETDMALVFFGSQTFGSVLPYGMTDVSAAASGVTVVGFTDSYTRSYRWLSSWTVGNQRRIGADEITESGDSGGPWIVKVAGTPRVVGVTGGHGGGRSYGFYISLKRYEGLRRYARNAHRYCVTGFQDKDYGGRSWSFCERGTVNALYGQFTADDKFTTIGAWKHSHWNDKFSSTKAGEMVRGKYYENVCSGTVWWAEFDRNLTDNIANGKSANDRISCVSPVLK